MEKTYNLDPTDEIFKGDILSKATEIENEEKTEKVTAKKTKKVKKSR